ncbi:uncharacterized protein LOC134815870 isoform X2 [Bolinopsis microptera]|uniref:uncharacterized protein LOC134815870 isoform X2 n=1 Tax=Bolinopsis microptera TaxID=2820187 RepID=UPI003078B8DA
MSFHMEAIRRSRTLAKKKDAQFALSAKEESKGQALEEHVENMCREYTFPRRAISSYEIPRYSTAPEAKSDSVLDKELWETQRKLRNSCLYMGPYYPGTGAWSAAQ